MTVLSHPRQRQLALASLSFAVFIALGCRESEQIRSYNVPKEAKVEVAAATPAILDEPTDRMLAAILPAGERAWFFKAVGPISTIDQYEKEINDFFAGLGLAEDGRANWKLPAGWKEEAGNQMRAATIVIPAEAKPLEITVNVLPWSGTQDGMLLNVNRWRGQLQLPAIGPQQLADVTREAKAGDRAITVVDLRGRFQAGAMTPPFAAGGPFAPAGGATQKPPAGLPPGHPPIDDAVTPPPKTTAAPAASGTPKFETPTGWQPLPAGGVRKAAFSIGSDQQGALVTIISFPATEGPMIADPLLNVNRWRREVGLGEIKQYELGSATESIEIDGKPATYARLVPDPSQTGQSRADRATLAAMVDDGDQLWFIKIFGDRSVVTAQEEAFKTFLKSVRFAADGGATDGNK